MNLTQLAEKHNIDPVAFRLAVQEWIDDQEVVGYYMISNGEVTMRKFKWRDKRFSPLIARPSLD